MWKTIEWSTNYSVSDEGLIRNDRTNTILNPYVNSLYLSVGLSYKGGKQITRRIHRIVAETFLPNPHNLPQVNHINCNKHDNRLINLEWCTGKQNIKHAIDNKAIDTKRAVCCFDLDGNFIAEYESLKEASIKTSGNLTRISGVINFRKNNNTSGGYRWFAKDRLVPVLYQ